MKTTITRVLICISILVICFKAGAQPQLKPANGPVGGYFQSIAALGSSVFAGNFLGGVYRSTDLGATWQQMDLGIDSFVAVAYLYTTDSLVFVAGNGYYGADTIFKSADGGNTWHGVVNSQTIGMAKLRNNLVAVTSGQPVITISDLSGEHWDTAAILPPYVQATSIVADDETVYVSTFSNGIFKSINGGLSWAQCPGFDTAYYAQQLYIYHHQLYVAGGATFYSTNGGATFITMPQSGLLCDHSYSMGVFNDSLYCYGSVLCLWDSALTAWLQLPQPLAGMAPYAFCQVQGSFFAACDNGVWVTTNGGNTWTEEGPGLLGGDITCIGSNGTALVAATETNNVSISYDNGLTWSVVPAPADSFATHSTIGLYFSNDTLIVNDYASANTQYLSLTTDYGATWHSLAQNLRHGFTAGVQFLVKGGRLIVEANMVGSNYHAQYSDDWGATWNNATGLQSTGVLLIDAGSLLYGSGYSNTGLFVSADRGATWAPVSNFALSPQRHVKCALVYDNKIFIGSDSGVVISADGGNTWAPSGSIINQGTLNNFFVLNGTVYVSSVYNIYQYDSANNTWPVACVAPVGVFMDNGVVQGQRYFSGTQNASVYYYSRQLPSGVPQTAEVSFSLYPNPAQSRFMVNSGQQAMQQIKITDMLGNLVLQYNTGNTFTQNLDVSQLSTGCYFVTVNTPQGSTTQRLVITR